MLGRAATIERQDGPAYTAQRNSLRPDRLADLIAAENEILFEPTHVYSRTVLRDGSINDMNGNDFIVSYRMPAPDVVEFLSLTDLQH